MLKIAGALDADIDAFIGGFREMNPAKDARGNARYQIVLRFIVEFTDRFGLVPTIREVAAALDAPSTSAALYALQRLAAADYIDLYAFVARGIVVTPKGVAAVRDGTPVLTTRRQLVAALAESWAA